MTANSFSEIMKEEATKLAVRPRKYHLYCLQKTKEVKEVREGESRVNRAEQLCEKGAQAKITKEANRSLQSG